MDGGVSAQHGRNSSAHLFFISCAVDRFYDAFEWVFYLTIHDDKQNGISRRLPFRGLGILLASSYRRSIVIF